MDLDDAANVGEILGGLAIIVTLIFGIRQITELNKQKKKEAGREIANLLASPMYQYGISILANIFDDDFTLADMENLDRKDKDALNFLVINTNSMAMMTFDRQLDFNTVSLFFQPLTTLLGTRFRQLVKNVRLNAINRGFGESDFLIMDWALWLMDRMDELPPLVSPANERFADWEP
ncbi:MAG: hypothetical protein VYB50_02495 [Candidatus Thermoplasmatota archaeon]|nr:hypothetical protein [Candidatus Thermoplasmatota archaeon]|tara:strand:- start:993 stop:1523 length:531 start_codon:yes stop_codon:yes gene_type:complete